MPTRDVISWLDGRLEISFYLILSIFLYTISTVICLDSRSYISSSPNSEVPANCRSPRYVLSRTSHCSCWTLIISKTVLGVSATKYLSEAVNYVFIMNGRISSITSYDDHCCSFFTSWAIDQQKSCIWTFWKNTQLWAYGAHPRLHLKPETRYF